MGIRVRELNRNIFPLTKEYRGFFLPTQTPQGRTGWRQAGREEQGREGEAKRLLVSGLEKQSLNMLELVINLTLLSALSSPTAVTAAANDSIFLASAVVVRRGTEPSCQS